MNEEENQAFKILHFYNLEDYGTEELKKYIKIIVNLVEKQQKEIEDLKKEKRILIEKYTEVVYECGKRNKEIAELRNIIFKFIPKSNHEVELRTKIIKLLGE